MSKFIKTLLISSAISLLLMSCLRPANKPIIKNTEWRLNTTESALSFVSIKNKTITEQHTLQFQNGFLDQQRNFEAVIDLNSVDTLIPIRDQRLRDILFETEQYPTAEVTTLIPSSLDLTTNQNFTLPFKLNLHGSEQLFEANVVIQTNGSQLVVVNYDPISVNAKQFGLDHAINQLTKIAGLQSINYGVLVDFKLTFEK